MKKIKLIYVSTDNLGAVVEGQVYKLLEYYQTQDVFSDILLLQPYKNDNNLEKAKELLKRYSFRKEFFYGRPLAPNKYFATLNSLKKLLKKEMTSDTVIHVRGSLISPFVRKALPKSFKNAYILTDIRGLALDELKVDHGKGFIRGLLAKYVMIPYANYLLKSLYQDKNVHITAVSPYFREVIVKDGVSSDRVCFNPNIVSPDFVFSAEDRKTIRDKYGIPDNQPVVVMSSGGNGIWQNDLAVLDRMLDLGYTVFNLGKNKIARKGVINGYLPRSEMPKYLSAADVAVLWREDIPLNNVACPSKFGEFVTMGLFVIHNGTVAIARQFITENNAGLIVNNPDEINIDASKFTFEERIRRANAGNQTFSVKSVSASYINHYLSKN